MNSGLKLLLLVVWASLAPISLSAADTPLVNRGDTWRYRKGTNAPQSDWKTVADAGLNATWLSGAGGFGYADGDDTTVLSDMLGGRATNYSTVYIRKEFIIGSAVDPSLHLILVMDWDDGYVAWLDGVELKRDRVTGAVGTEPAFNARASSTHEASGGGGTIVTNDLGAVGDRLGVGTHVLSLVGLNENTNSSDFSLIADLKLREPSAPPLLSHSDTWRYRKGTNAPPANWQTLPDASLDASWASGPGGFGFADGDDATTLSDMRNNYTTVYIRREFTIASPIATNLIAQLSMDWDDGFVAWLDGVEVARQLAPGSVGSEPAFGDVATGLHEAVGGGGTASTFDLGPAAVLLPPGPHTLAILGLNESLDSSDVSLIADLLLVTAPTNTPPGPNGCVYGTIATSTTWYATNSPVTVCGNLTVLSGATLTIEPGVTVRFDPGFGLTINGRLLAEGTVENKIIFTRSGPSGTWSQLAFTANSTTSRIAHAEMDYFAAPAITATGTSLHLDDIVWTNSTAAVVDLHTSSVTLLNSFIPGGAGNEPVHFSTMPANGHALIKGCVFGAPRGYNDSIDFTGGNRPGPIVQFIDNVFLAGVDDCFDMDATDAHIEGNIFMNVLQDDERDSSSNPISTGEGSATSELIVCRNIFFNSEHALLLKDGGSAVMQNNTIVHLVTNVFARTAAPPGGEAIPPGLILFGEPWRSGRTPGTGAILEGNIAYDLHPLVQADPFPLYSSDDSFLVVSRSLIQGVTWPGVGNISGDPLFVNSAGPMTAQNIRSNLTLLAGSPCLGTGPNGLDMGALVPSGASISGAPAGLTTNTSASLRVAGPGVVAFRWRLNTGPWSQEIPLTNSILITTNYFNATNGLITLNGLADGSYTFSAIGKNSAGSWQETNAAATKTWTVETSAPLRIENASRNGNVVTFTFVAQAGLSYRVLYRDALDGAHPWQKLADIPPQGMTGPYPFTDSTATPSVRFYQIVTP